MTIKEKYFLYFSMEKENLIVWLIINRKGEGKGEKREFDAISAISGSQVFDINLQ